MYHDGDGIVAHAGTQSTKEHRFIPFSLITTILNGCHMLNVLPAIIAFVVYCTCINFLLLLYAQISIGAGVSIGKHQWDALQSQQKHSLFVKGLAVAVWGTDTLKDRSLDGKVCPRFKNEREPRPPLSPEKLKAVKGM